MSAYFGIYVQPKEEWYKYVKGGDGRNAFCLFSLGTTYARELARELGLTCGKNTLVDEGFLRNLFHFYKHKAKECEAERKKLKDRIQSLYATIKDVKSETTLSTILNKIDELQCGLDYIEEHDADNYLFYKSTQQHVQVIDNMMEDNEYGLESGDGWVYYYFFE